LTIDNAFNNEWTINNAFIGNYKKNCPLSIVHCQLSIVNYQLSIKKNMFLGIDIGNSNIVLGIHDGTQWSDTCRIPTHEKNFSTLISFLKKHPEAWQKVALSSVAPSATANILPVLASLNIEPYLINTSTFPFLKITIVNTKEIGTDLVANAVIGHELAPNQHKIIIDFGTALTFTTVDNHGKIIGVAIAPGIKTAMFSLFENAEQLPEVPIELPKSALGTNTVEALQAGVVMGYTGLIKGLIEQIKQEIDAPCQVFATGGLAFVMQPIHHLFDRIDVNLTLDGIRTIYNQVQ
jgi:type III pantothenate kinase